MTETNFISNISELRDRARQHIERGAVTEGYEGQRDAAVKLLNEALATEIVCVLRYKRHHYMAKGIHAEPIIDRFLEYANEEQGHADMIAERIIQLGGEPDLNPKILAERSHTEYVEGKSLTDMIREDLVAERIVIDSYREMIQYFDKKDPTSRRVMEQILAAEEDHAEDLSSLLAGS